MPDVIQSELNAGVNPATHTKLTKVLRAERPPHPSASPARRSLTNA